MRLRTHRGTREISGTCIEFSFPSVTVVSGRLVGWPHCMPFLATSLKLWEKYDLTVDPRDLGNGSAAAEAIAAGSSPFGYVNVPNAIALLQVGLPIKILAATTIGGTTVYTFNDQIKSVADLRGKKVAIPRGVSTHALQFEMYVAPHAGLDTKRDLEIVPLAPTDNITAMRRGDIDAAVSFDPYVSQATYFCCCSRECRCGIEVSAAPIILISNFGLLEPRLLSDVIVRGIWL